MGRRPGRPCKTIGCPRLAVSSGYCADHQGMVKRDRSYDRERGTAAQRGYGSRWQRYRLRYLSEHPLCVICLAKMPSVLREASVVDHIKPHHGEDDPLFWSPANHQALCKECHDRKTASENGGFGNAKRG